MPIGAEVKAFVGPNGSYYLHQWKGALKGEAGGTGFNMAAFLCAGLWLPYRRLYGHAFVVYGLFLIFDILTAVVEMARPTSGYETPLALGCGQLVLVVVIWIVVGACANQWYLAQFRRATAESRTRTQNEAEHLRALARRSGIDVFALFAFPIASVALSVLVRIVFFVLAAF